MLATTEQRWRTRARVGALTLAVAAGLAACTTTQPSATPSSSPSPSFAADVAEQCEEIADAIVAGRLRDADDLLADAKLGGADPTCADEAKAVVAERRTQAAELVEAARTTPAQAAVLAAAALRLDDSNIQARAIADVTAVTLPAGIPTPSLSFAPQRPSSQATAPDPCASAREALSEGRFTEAKELVDALGDDVTCADAVKTEITERQAAQPLQRVWRSLTDDRLWQLLLAATLVVLGAVLARVSTAGRRPSRLKRGRWVPTITGVVLAVGILAPAVAQLWPAFVEGLPGGVRGVLWDAATAAAALGFGYAQVRYLRAIAPTMVEVIDNSGKSVDNSTFGTLVVSEVSTIAEESPGGVFAVKGGSDLADSGVNAALDTVTQKYLKAVVTVWRTVTTGLGDRVRINLVGTDTDPVAAVVIRRGARTVLDERIDTRDLRVDKGQPSETEKASATQDLATAVAARVVLEYLGLVGSDAGQDVRVPATTLARLYGVTQPRSLAVAAVAARHSERGRYPEAVELFARAQGIDPGNLAARYGRDVNTLRTRAAGDDGRVALEDLEATLEVLTDRQAAQPESPLPLLWRCRYNVAVHRANRILSGGIPDPGTPAMNQLVTHRARLAVLARQMEYRATAPTAGDRRLASRLGHLAACAAAGLQAAEGRPASQLRPQLIRLQGEASARGLVNLANGYALLWTSKRAVAGGPRTLGGARQDLLTAVDLMRLAGLEVGVRPDILADPVLRLLRTTEPHRALARSWDGEEGVPYALIQSIGDRTAKTLGRWYPTTADLRRAIAKKRTRDLVLQRAGADASNVPWWDGALAWLDAGRDVAPINAYQAAGIRDAAQAQSLTDAGVVAALRRRRKDDPTLVVPDARVRALMAS